MDHFIQLLDWVACPSGDLLDSVGHGLTLMWTCVCLGLVVDGFKTLVSPKVTLEHKGKTR